MSLAETLRRRDVPEPSATLASELGMAAFKLAFEHWVNDPKRQGLAAHVKKALRALKAVVV